MKVEGSRGRAITGFFIKLQAGVTHPADDSFVSWTGSLRSPKALRDAKNDPRILQTAVTPYPAGEDAKRSTVLA